ncbi:MAG: hypothetical protein JJ900_17375 [Rhodospirillales bacterium]|nr:hypothetical protein [Rhodospirillales bacterium]MBO6788623.1 hypothetical protein [Rhodospirillales bacterium]
MKLPRTIRLDPSDARVFARAAEPGEWAVTGTFAFVDAVPGELDNKTQLAFKSGWLGLDSFGFSTFVQVTVVPEGEDEAAARALAVHLFETYGAPDMLMAMTAARSEIAYAASLCDQPAGTLLAIDREMTEDGITEKIKVVPRPDEDGGHAQIWTIAEDC